MDGADNKNGMTVNVSGRLLHSVKRADVGIVPSLPEMKDSRGT